MKTYKISILLIILGLSLNSICYSQSNDNKPGKKEFFNVVSKVKEYIDSKEFATAYKKIILDACKDTVDANKNIQDAFTELMEQKFDKIVYDAGFKDKADFEKLVTASDKDPQIKQASEDFGKYIIKRLCALILEDKEILKQIPKEVKQNFEMMKQFSEEQNQAPAK